MSVMVVVWGAFVVVWVFGSGSDALGVGPRLSSLICRASLPCVISEGRIAAACLTDSVGLTRSVTDSLTSYRIGLHSPLGIPLPEINSWNASSIGIPSDRTYNYLDLYASSY